MHPAELKIAQLKIALTSIPKSAKLRKQKNNLAKVTATIFYTLEKA